MSAEWKVIPGFSKYEASTGGEIRRLDGSKPVCGRKITGNVHACGHRIYVLSNDLGIVTRKYGHQLVMLAHVGQCPDGMSVCHENGIADDNRLENLRYDTHASNMEDKRKHGTLYKGESVYCAVLTEESVLEIRNRCAAGESHAAIARAFGVSRAAISLVALGRTWSHVGGPITNRRSVA